MEQIDYNYLYDLISLTTRLIEVVADGKENVKREVILMGGGRVLEMESEKIYNEGIAQGLSQGISQGISQGMSQGIAGSILSFLSRCHEVPESLRERILAEKDIDKLNNWIMLAPYVSSIEEFEEKM